MSTCPSFTNLYGNQGPCPLNITSRQTTYRNTGIAGATSFHSAIDLATGTRKPDNLYATEGATVVGIGSGTGRGHYLVYELDRLDANGNKVNVLIQHLNSVAQELTVGSHIEPGQFIAMSGNTGVGSGIHVHTEVFTTNASTNNNTWYDAAAYMNSGTIEKFKTSDGLYMSNSNYSQAYHPNNCFGSYTMNQVPRTGSEPSVREGSNSYRTLPKEPEYKPSETATTYKGTTKTTTTTGTTSEIEDPDATPQIAKQNIKETVQCITHNVSSVDLSSLNSLWGEVNAENTPNYVTQYEKYNQINGLEQEFYETGFAYIFITKPDINLKDASDSFTRFIYANYPEIINSLSYSVQYGGGTNFIPDFIPLLTNTFVNIGGIDDITNGEVDVNETFRGYKIKLPTSYVPSINGGSISITYRELNPPLISYLHKVWFDYIEAVRMGYVEQNYSARMDKILNYASSLYYFATEPDGETLRFWAKYTGIIPNAVPYSSLTSNPGSHEVVQISIPYIYSYREVLDINVIRDFNDTVAHVSGIYNLYEQSDANVLEQQERANVESATGESLLKVDTSMDVYEQANVADKTPNVHNDYFFSKMHIIRDGRDFRLIMR